MPPGISMLYSYFNYKHNLFSQNSNKLYSMSESVNLKPIYKYKKYNNIY